MEFVIIAGVIQIGAIGITSIVSAFRSKSNGWRDLKEDSFDPDFCFRSASRNRKKLRYLCSKSKKGKISSSQELALTNEDQANIPGSRAAGTSVRNTPFSQPGRKCKCTILFSDTGGGHRASAQAVVAAFERAYPGRYEFELLDIWRFHSVKPFNTLVETYQFAAKNPWVWELMYVNADFPITRFIFQELGSTFSFKKFQAILEEKAPDLVISVHPLCQNLPLRVLKAMGKGRREIPFVTIVTDLGGAHPTWFDPDADQVYVPSGPVRQMAFRERVAPKQLLQYGLPVRPDFWKEAGDKEELQKKLGMKESIKSVLVVGGGDGVGGLKKVTLAVIKRLSKETEARQAVIVCGSNKKLKKELDDMSFPANVSVLVQGFVNNMDEWMAACDVLITKAGPGTIAEAAIRGIPVMLSNYLPGQEEGNLDFVRENGFGEYSADPLIIADTVSNWLNDPEKLDKMSKNARIAGRPTATNDIVQGISSFLGI